MRYSIILVINFVFSISLYASSQTCGWFFKTEQFPLPMVFLDVEESLVSTTVKMTTDSLLEAYSKGIFPWRDTGWYSPKERGVLFLDEYQVNRTTRKAIRNSGYRATFNENFEAVIRGASSVKRPTTKTTWITETFIEEYIKLHHLGFAQSVEVWQGREFVGGLYGVYYQGTFVGESMVSLKPNASKVALYYLVEALKQEGVEYIDTQVVTDIMGKAGAREIPRADYLQMLKKTQEKYIEKGSSQGINSLTHPI